MPRIDSYLYDTRWGDLHEATKEYIEKKMIDTAQTYMYNYDNDFLEETGGDLYPVAFLKGGLYIKVDLVEVWSCNLGGGVHIKFNDNESFERL